MTLLFLLLLPLLIGAQVLRAMGFRWREEPLGCWAAAWLLGCLVLGACVQVAIELQLPPHWLPLLASAPLLLAGVRRRVPAGAADQTAGPPVGRGYALFVAAGAALALLFAAAGMDRPCIEGDEGNIWSLKAKSLLVDWPAQFAGAQVHNLHPDYPQLNPLLQALTYAVCDVRAFVQFENRWLVQGCDIALFVALAAALRRRLPAVPSALLASLLLLEPEFQGLCRTAYADGMVALGLVVAVDAFLRWRDGGPRACGWLAGLGLAFAAWSKNETMLYLVCAALAALLTYRRVPRRPGGGAWRDLVMLTPVLLVVLYTALWNRRFGMASDLLGSNPTGKSMFTLIVEQAFERVPAVFVEAASLLGSLGHAHVVFALLLLGGGLAPRVVLGRRLALPVLGVLGAFAGIHLVYVGSFLELRMHLDTSHARVLFQLLPVALLLVGAAAADVAATRRARHTAGGP